MNESFPDGADDGVLRLITAGSVDDGKSTLIGRLLYDSKGILADQLEAIAHARHKRAAGGGIDFSLLTDGLEAEREQGITIDVAYRYFSTPRRKFIIADAPGHEQYTRNMVTGASTANAAIILIDATRAAGGQLLPQTKRHSTIARLLGIRHIVAAVNKMDLVDWKREVFDGIRSAYDDLARRLGIADFHILPLSALHGDNVVTASTHSPWYAEPPLLDLLERLSVADDGRDAPLRLPVQWVLRHGGDRIDGFRGYAGRVASGTLRVGETLVAQPSGIEARVAGLIVSGREAGKAMAGDAVTVTLDRDVDISRGDILSHPGSPARTGRRFEAELCWLDDSPLNPARRYLIKHGPRVTSARILAIHARRDIHELREVPGEGGTLAMNDIGRVSLMTRETLAADRYEDLPANGAFILIDEASHQTAAAGMLR